MPAVRQYSETQAAHILPHSLNTFNDTKDHVSYLVQGYCSMQLADTLHIIENGSCDYLAVAQELGPIIVRRFFDGPWDQR